MPKLKVLDLFSGIGGFSLGLERATHNGKYTGFETVAFCEIEEFPRKVLAKHWPEVPCYRDVRELTAEQLAADGIAVDVICGGFPCQDISFAGKGAGLEGERSGLFYEVARIIGELGPRFLILENVGALLSRGLDAVLGTLASLGYDAEWHCIPASAVGAPHRRDRVWILAYPQCEQQRQDTAPQRRKVGLGGEAAPERSESASSTTGCGGILADTESKRCGEAREHSERPAQRFAGRSEILADAPSIGHPRPRVLTKWCRAEANGAREAAYALAGGVDRQWEAEPNVGRVADGVPDRSHRLKALGNAVVPQIPELIGNALLSAMNDCRAHPLGAHPARKNAVSGKLHRMGLTIPKNNPVNLGERE